MADQTFRHEALREIPVARIVMLCRVSGTC